MPLTAAALAALGFACLAALPASAGVEDVCGIDSPGWEIIGEASSSDTTPSGFQCNYRVLRNQVRLSDGSVVDLGQSGVAINIAYFCTPELGRERYETVASARTTETYRDDAAGVLITEEGPAAKNPDNPQSKGVFSQFYVDSNGDPILRGLQEKEWRLLSPQVLATLVVLTDERGKVDETERFGVEQAEVVARDLANRSRSAAGCDIPEVGAGATAPATGGGGLPVNLLIGVGGIAVIVIGGYTVWKRRPGKAGKVAPKVSSKVPEQCRGIATVFDDQIQTFTTLREAEVDLRQQLERAEKIHRNNIIKAKMVVNLEIISAFGNTATDLALALRPAVLRRVGPGAIGQKDTWKPPGSISAKWADAIRRAEAAAGSALSRLRSLNEEIDALTAGLRQKVLELPSIRNAQQLAEYHANRLSQMVKDLPKANKLRTQLVELEQASEVISGQRRLLQETINPIERGLSDLQSKLNTVNNVIASKQGLLPRDLKAAEDALASLHARGIEDTARLGSAEDLIDSVRNQLSRVSSDAEFQQAAAEAKQLEQQIASHQANLLDPLQKQLEPLSKKDVDLLKRRQKIKVQLRGLEDITQPDIDMQKRVADDAQKELRDAISQGREQLGQELAQKQAAAHKAEVDAASAQGALDDFRAQAEQETLRSGMGTPTDTGGIVSSIGKAIWWASAPIRYPLNIAGELVFGVGQSPQEIMEILLQGRTNMQTLRSHLGAVSRAKYDQQRKISSVRRQLDDCIQGKAVKGIDVPADAGARAA